MIENKLHGFQPNQLGGKKKSQSEHTHRPGKLKINSRTEFRASPGKHTAAYRPITSTTRLKVSTISLLILMTTAAISDPNGAKLELELGERGGVD